jgi:hypothetical protein
VAATSVSLRWHLPDDEQAGQLAFYGKNPIVATDADLAGRVAAERDLWILTPHRLDPPVCAAARGQ